MMSMESTVIMAEYDQSIFVREGNPGKLNSPLYSYLVYLNIFFYSD